MMAQTTFHGGCVTTSHGLGGVRFRCRLTSRSDVKCAVRTGRSQNRQLMRGGRA